MGIELIAALSGVGLAILNIAALIFKSMFNERQKNIEELGNRLASGDAITKSLEAKVERLSTELNEKITDAMKIKFEYDNLQTEHTSTVARLDSGESNIGLLKTLADKLQAELVSVQSNVIRNQSTIIAVQEENRRHVESVQRYELLHAAFQIEIAAFQVQIKDIDEQLKASKSHSDKIMQVNEALSRDLRLSKEEAKRLKEEKQALLLRIEGLEHRVRTLEQKPETPNSGD